MAMNTTAASAANGGIIPNDLDILCGKTKHIVNHPGTIRYQQILDSYTERYIQADTKMAKMTVTKTLYEQLKTTSRFLKFNEKEQIWEEISSLAARDKIGHALRFAVKVSTNNNNNNNSNEDNKNNNNNNKKSGPTKKRAKGRRRGHRRVGSDFSAASMNSIFSEASVNTTATATSDGGGGEAIKSLVLTLNTTFTINEPQVTTTTETAATTTSVNPPAPASLLATAVGTAGATTAHPLTTSSPPVPPKQVFTPNNHVEVPTMSTGAVAAAAVSEQDNNDPFLLWLENNNDDPNNIQVLDNLDEGNRLADTSNLNLNYSNKKENHQPLFMAQQQQCHRRCQSEPPMPQQDEPHKLYQVFGNNVDYNSAKILPPQQQPVAVAAASSPSLQEINDTAAAAAAFPMLEIVTTNTIPEGECYDDNNRDGGVDKMSQDFLSMLRDPIYDLDADDF